MSDGGNETSCPAWDCVCDTKCYRRREAYEYIWSGYCILIAMCSVSWVALLFVSIRSGWRTKMLFRQQGGCCRLSSTPECMDAKRKVYRIALAATVIITFRQLRGAFLLITGGTWGGVAGNGEESIAVDFLNLILLKVPQLMLILSVTLLIIVFYVVVSAAKHLQRVNRTSTKQAVDRRVKTAGAALVVVVLSTQILAAAGVAEQLALALSNLALGFAMIALTLGGIVYGRGIAKLMGSVASMKVRRTESLTASSGADSEEIVALSNDAIELRRRMALTRRAVWMLVFAGLFSTFSALFCAMFTWTIGLHLTCWYLAQGSELLATIAIFSSCDEELLNFTHGRRASSSVHVDIASTTASSTRGTSSSGAGSAEEEDRGDSNGG